MRCFLVVPLLALLSARAAAADAKVVAPFVDQQTLAVASVETSRLNIDAIFVKLAKLGGREAKDLPAVKAAFSKRLKALTSAGVKDVYVVFSLATLPKDSPFVVIPVPEGKDARALAKALNEEKNAGALRFEVRGTVVLGASKHTFNYLRDFKPEARPELARALAAVDGVVRVAVAPGSTLRRALSEALPRLPRELGGGPTTAFTQGVRWLALGLDLPPKAAVRLTVQTPDAAAAKALQGAVVNLFKAAAKHKELRAIVPDFDKLAGSFMPQVKGDRLTLVVEEDALTKLVLPVLQRVRMAAAQTRDVNTLKQFGIALHNYHDVNGHFPAAASSDKKKRRLLSWRVHILPYIEQTPLYKQFHLDEPWDSAHNKKLIKRMPKLFATATNPRLAAAYKTSYLAPVGLATIFPGLKSVKITEVTDGTSNTILLVDADDKHAVVWTKPDDLAHDPANPAKGLRLHAGKKFLFLFADGSVRYVPAKVAKKTLAAIFTRNGGEVVNLP